MLRQTGPRIVLNKAVLSAHVNHDHQALTLIFYRRLLFSRVRSLLGAKSTTLSAGVALETCHEKQKFNLDNPCSSVVCKLPVVRRKQRPPAVRFLDH